MKLTRRELIKNAGLLGLGGFAAGLSNPVRVFGDLEHITADPSAPILNHTPLGTIVCAQGTKEGGPTELVLIHPDGHSIYPMGYSIGGIVGSPLGESVAVLNGPGTRVDIVSNKDGLINTAIPNMGLDHITDIAFSPDGKKMVLSVTQTKLGDNVLYANNVGQQDITQVTARPLGLVDTENISDISPCFSPDGNSLAFIRYNNGLLKNTYQELKKASIMTIDLKSGSQQEIYSIGPDSKKAFRPGHYWNGFHQLSFLDNERVAWLIVGTHSEYYLQVYDKGTVSVGIDSKPFPSIEGFAYGFSPDRKKLVYPVYDSGTLNVISLDDAKVSTIPIVSTETNLEKVPSRVIWSPDSMRLLYSGLETALGAINLYWADLRTKESMRLTGYTGLVELSSNQPCSSGGGQTTYEVSRAFGAWLGDSKG